MVCDVIYRHNDLYCFSIYAMKYSYDMNLTIYDIDPEQILIKTFHKVPEFFYMVPLILKLALLRF